MSALQKNSMPVYYSQGAIYLFSILFTPFFGAFLISANNEDKGRSRWPVVIFGLFITIAISLLLSMSHLRSTTSNFIANSFGVALMYELYWNKYKTTNGNYGPKSIKTPLLFALGIAAIYVAFMLRLLL